MYCGRFFSFSWMLGLFANGIKASDKRFSVVFVVAVCWLLVIILMVADWDPISWLLLLLMVVFNYFCLFVAVSWFSVAVCRLLFWSLLEFCFLVAAVCNLLVVVATCCSLVAVKLQFFLILIEFCLFLVSCRFLLVAVIFWWLKVAVCCLRVTVWPLFVAT